MVQTCKSSNFFMFKMAGYILTKIIKSCFLALYNYYLNKKLLWLIGSENPDIFLSNEIGKSEDLNLIRT